MRLSPILLAPIVALGLFGATTMAQKPIATFNAQAVNLDAPPGRVAGPIQIQITRWSTKAEADQLHTVLTEQGSNKLLDVLSKLPSVGVIRTPDSVGYDLRYARETKTATGDRIVIVTDRPVSFWEARAQSRSTDYPFTFIEMHLGANGKGDGKLSVATKIVENKKTQTMELENYGIGPVLLQSVERSN